VREIEFAAAYSDYDQEGFTAASILKKRDVKKEGWAVAGKTTEAHQLTLVPSSPVKAAAGSTLRVRIEHLSEHKQHTLGGFKLGVTTVPGVAEYARTPADIVPILALAADKRSEAQKKQLAAHFRSVSPTLKKQRDELAKLQKQLKEAKPTTTVPVMKELAKPRTTKIQLRGNFLDTGDEVGPGLPAVFAIPTADGKPSRMTLAKWLVSPDNPLTARVIVNRYWEHLFGVGIVLTSEEFGAQGDLPAHPELLDWLAVDLMESGWDIKKLIRLMVTSASYRQESRVTDEMFERDPDNRYLARGPRFRLSAEMVRDQALSAGGLLSAKMYGPPVQPPQPNLGVKAAFGSGIDWKTSSGEDKFRRGLYTRWRRSNPYPSMVTFDAVNREVCTVRRDRTNTPLQALVTLNDPVYVEAAQGLGRRMAATDGSIADKLSAGFRICVSRPPRASELKRLEALYGGALERLAKEPAKATALATKPIGALPAGAKAPEYAAWAVVGNVLLNLDEMLMKR
jgi:hypothetical protein